MNLKAILREACEEGRTWAGDKTARQIWDDCPRGDWLLWFAYRVKVKRRDLILASCACARRSLRFVTPGENRPRLAIEAAERCAKSRTKANIEAAESAARSAEHKACADIVREVLKEYRPSTKEERWSA